ncbi:hypothetical protein AGMMS49944_04180 [Spirochaetia bacterium]|nr:hypothetical protein AGMMS49944_04180 [Spirochaetia bacterium]
MASNNSVETIKLMLYWQRKALKPSQRKSPRIVSMSYPLAVEKKYALMLRTWMKPLMDFTTDFIRQNGEDLIRGDAAMELVIRCDALPGDLFTRLVDSLNGWMDTYVTEEARQTPGFGPTIWMGLGQAADDLNEANYTQWKKSSKSAMGVEFPKDEEWWPKTKQDWQKQNYTLFEKMGKEYVTQINNVTEQAVVNGWSVRQLVEEISKIDTTMKKSRVNLIARDQIGKLNSMATQDRMQHAGLNMYIWETAHDERVRGNPGGKYPNARPSHHLMDGLLCRWDDPTVYSEDGGKTWIPRDADAPLAHPGMEIQCRCIATAYWEELMGEVDLKIAKEEGKISGISGEDELSGQKKPASEPIPEKPAARSTKTGIKKDIIPAGILLVLNEILTAGQKNGKENMKVMTSDGTVLAFQSGEGADGNHRIQLTDKNMSVLKSLPDNTVSISHNHSTGEGFSGEDLALLCDFHSLKEIRVIGHNGMTYAMIVGEGQRPEAKTVKALHAKLLGEKVFENMGKIERGDITLEEALILAVREVNMAIAEKYGWTYKEGKLDG